MFLGHTSLLKQRADDALGDSYDLEIKKFCKEAKVEAATRRCTFDYGEVVQKKVHT